MQEDKDTGAPLFAFIMAIIAIIAICAIVELCNGR